MAQAHDHIMHFIGRNDRLADVDTLVRVSAIALDDRHAVTEMLDVIIAERFRVARRRFDGDLFITVMEGRDRLRRDELKNDGIGRMLPTEHRAEDGEDEHIKDEDIIPDRFMDAVGHIHRDEIRSAGGAVCLQGQRDGKTIEKAAESDIEDDIIEDRIKLQHAQQK